jgi:AraC family transcriptional regulator
MNLSFPVEAEKPALQQREEPAFTEVTAWEPVGGWQPLHGSFRERGFSIEWHDFTTERDFDWSRSFHPGGLEICLNLAGHGEVQASRRTLELTASTAGFYIQNDSRLTALRRGRDRHQFVTIELALPFLEQHVPTGERGLHPRLKNIFGNNARAAAAVSEPTRLTSEQQQLVMSLRRPPVFAAAQRMWYQAKALEVAASLLYQPLPGEELFCQRHKRLSHERVEKVIAILKENLVEPPALEEIGRRVGCSHFYLSRTFTQEMGKTISAYLRDLRMERAAEMLREGKLNVTQVALEVGYSSPSHFSMAFHAAFGCCPGLYPLATPAQRQIRPDSVS